MAGKNIKVMELPRNLYFEGSPVIISSTSLLMNSADKKMFVAIKMRNLTDKTITSVDVEITPLGVTGKEIGSVIGHTYANLKCGRNEEFGEDVLVSIPSSNPRSLSVRLTGIEFDDGSVFEDNGCEYEAIPRPRPLKSHYNEFQLATFSKLFGSNGKYLPFEYKDLRVCTCGAILRSDENICFDCKNDFEKLISVDSEQLRKSGIYEKACETLSKADSGKLLTSMTDEATYRNALYLISNQKDRLFTYTNDVDNIIKTYASARKQFESIGDWEDSEEKIAYCNEKTEYYESVISKRKDKALADAEEMKKKILAGAKLGAKIAAVALVVILVFSFFNKILIAPLSEYNSAIEAAENGNYSEAYEILDDLGKFKDSPEKIKEIKNMEAQQLIENGEFTSAYIILEKIGNYEAIKENKLQRGIALINSGNYTDAYELLEEIAGYKTATEEIRKSKYERGKALIAEEKFDSGYALLEEIADYKDAKTLVLESKYSRAKAHLAAQEFDKAYALLDKIPEYKDAKAIVDKSRYERGTAILASGDFDGAVAILSHCLDYLDTKKLLSDDCYKKAEAFTAKGKYSEAAAYYEKVDAALYPDAPAKSQASKVLVDAKSKFDKGDYKSALAVCEKIKGNSAADSMASKCRTYINTIESYCGNYIGYSYGDPVILTVTYDYSTKKMKFKDDTYYTYRNGEVYFDVNNPNAKLIRYYGDENSYYYQFNGNQLRVRLSDETEVFTKIS